MKKLALVLALAATLAACGKADEDTSAASSSSATSTPADTSAANSASTSSTPSAGDTNTASGSAAPALPGTPPTDTTASGGSASGSSDSSSGATSGTAMMGAAASGQGVYNQACQMCHAAGVAGAPKLGDKADWGPRVAQGNDTLYQHAIQGYTGKKGVMPPKGGNTALADADVKAAVDYMVAQSR